MAICPDADTDPTAALPLKVKFPPLVERENATRPYGRGEYVAGEGAGHIERLPVRKDIGLRQQGEQGGIDKHLLPLRLSTRARHRAEKEGVVARVHHEVANDPGDGPNGAAIIRGGRGADDGQAARPGDERGVGRVGYKEGVCHAALVSSS